jgi:hypothetical protein
MTPAQVQELADRLASILISHAAHGLATSSLEGMGEITLRDSLIVAAAATGAEIKQAWVFQREVLPDGWTDSAVDLVLYRKGNNDALKEVGGVELKWWRQEDKGNASNRRRDLVKDFIRAASLYAKVEDFAFVALLSTEVSWASTTETTGADAEAMQLVTSSASQKWNIRSLIDSTAVKQSVRKLQGKVPIPNIFHSRLLTTLSLEFASGRSAFAKIWAIKKPQNTRMLSSGEIDDLLS